MKEFIECVNLLIFQIYYRKFFSIFSLLLNIIGTIILSLPLLKTTRDLDDDLIVGENHEVVNGKEKFFYTRKRFLKDRKLGLWGLGLLGFGFLIQLLFIIL